MTEEEKPIEPEEAVRLVTDYKGVTAHALTMQSGRSYANLMAAFCLKYPEDPVTPSLLFKAWKHAPATAHLVTGHINWALPEDSKAVQIWHDRLTNLRSPQPTMEEANDFMHLCITIAQRNPKRIDPFLKEISKLWAKNADLRFMQLVSLLEHHGVNFNTEEAETYIVIQRLLNQ